MGKLAVVLSGGGAKGSFQVGVIKRLVEKKIFPDIVIGISTGSLQAVGWALNPFGHLLNEVWSNIKSEKDIYTKSLFNYINCILGKKSGIYEFDGLRNILKKYFNKEKIINSPIDCYVGHVSLQTSQLNYIDKYNLTIDDIIASCTIPITFPPVEKNGHQLVDGGVRDIVPLKKAIDLGADKIIVVLCSNVNLKNIGICKNIIDVSLRVLEILLNEIFVNDIENCLRINELIKNTKQSKYKYIDIKVIQPSEDIIDTLEFNPEKIKRNIEHGYYKALEII